jgi:nucleotide-binding universal stress UspA family protein
MRRQPQSVQADRFRPWAPRAGHDTGLGKQPALRDAHSPARPPPIRTVLVPVDGSPASEPALPLAAGIARRAGARVVLAHVYSPLSAPSDPARFRFSEPVLPLGPIRQHLGELARRLTTAGVAARPVVQEGTSADETLARIADEERADLVVMAAGARGWWDRVFWPSVTAGFVRRSRCPVVLVPSRAGSPDLTRDLPLGRILIPLDQSARAERVLGPAVAIGTTTGASYDLIHAVRPARANPGWSVAYGGAVAVPAAAQRAEAARYLRSVARRLRARSVRTRWEVVTDDRPAADAIVRHAERTGAHLIALATRGRGAVARLFWGSVAARVARRATVPVLLHRPGEGADALWPAPVGPDA